MGAGKTSIGRRLARRFGLQFVDLDREIEAETGAGITLIFEHEGEAGFRPRTRKLQECSAKHGMLLACGGGIVLDAGNRGLLASGDSWSGWTLVWSSSWRDCARPQPTAAGRADRRQRLQAMAAERNPLYAATCELRIDVGRTNVARHAAGGTCIGQSWQRDRMRRLRHERATDHPGRAG